MPYLADLGTEVERVSHSTLQAATDAGGDTDKPYYVVPGHELQQVRLSSLRESILPLSGLTENIKICIVL